MPKSAVGLRQLLEKSVFTLEYRKQTITSVEFATALCLHSSTEFYTMSVLRIQAEHQKWRWDFSCRYICFLTLQWYLFSRFDQGTDSVQVAAQDTELEGAQGSCQINCPQHNGRPKHGKEPLPILQNIQRKMIPQTLLKSISSARTLDLSLHISTRLPEFLMISRES